MIPIPRGTRHICLRTRENLARFLRSLFPHRVALCSGASGTGSSMSRTRLPNRLLDLWKSNRPAITGWLCIGNSVTAEAMARTGPDCCLVDMQHGMIDDGTAISMFAAISAVPNVTPIARVRANQPDKIHFLLDAGALGIVCPLINTETEVEEFVAACKYPPQGSRSFGPGRGHFISPNYREIANDSIATLAMIETRKAIDNLHKILAVKGLDAVFIGPNDLALSLGIPPSSDPTNPEILEVITYIQQEAQRHGKKTGIFCGSGDTARDMAARGFDLVCPGFDIGHLMGHAAQELGHYRGAEAEIVRRRAEALESGRKVDFPTAVLEGKGRKGGKESPKKKGPNTGY